MKTVHIAAGSEYDAIIGRGLINRAGEYIARLFSPCRVLLVADDTVFSLYGKTVAESLEDAGFDVSVFKHAPGESAKSAEKYTELLNCAGNAGFSKGDIFLSLGGGVTGDLTGFAAATYLRGVKYIQMPTTVLAAVDSSVGGKTAINLQSGKNRAGAFYQPSAVICDLDTFKTLNEADYRFGCAEIIKYAVIFDGELFTALSESGIKENEEDIVSRCVDIKRQIVEADEFDTGIRHILNFGHTVGHAVEKCTDYRISHGEAVSIGMAVIMRASADAGFCSADMRDKVISLLKKYRLPVNTEIPADLLYRAALGDKKITGDKIDLVVPREIGKCEVMSFDINELKRITAYG